MATVDFRQFPVPFPVETSRRPSHPVLSSSTTTYEILNVISRGSYGVVYRAREQRTGQMVAVKEELSGLSKSTEREINILDSLPYHPSIVQLKDLTMDDSRSVFVVMEYMDYDIKRLMESKNMKPFSEIEVKYIAKQLLEGVAFLHENRVMHRDLKPSNILIDESDFGRLKICDFGLSRCLDGRRDWDAGGAYTPEVMTLWYKAPELLLGADEYSCAVDMWSVGCILGEMLLGEVLFRGSCEIGQLVSIWDVLGTPNDEVWPGFSSLPGSQLLNQLGEQQSYDLLGIMFQSFSAGCVDLLRRLLTYDPKKRITAREALRHNWFEESSYGL